MGLITGLLTLPLAPVRGAVWLAERVQEQAERELADESAIYTGLLELDSMRETGELSEDEIAAAENELLEHLIAVRGFGQEVGDGTRQ